eukprot:6014960-Pyramimonas_sp.AAC.1
MTRCVQSSATGSRACLAPAATAQTEESMTAFVLPDDFAGRLDSVIVRMLGADEGKCVHRHRRRCD